jgi:hypothetical protein
MVEANVFEALYHYGPHAEENYLSESFVFVLRMLLQRRPVAGLTVLNALCAARGGWSFTNAAEIAIATQIATDSGRPDIEIRASATLAFVEVKHDAPLSAGQLEVYEPSFGSPARPIRNWSY